MTCSHTHICGCCSKGITLSNNDIKEIVTTLLDSKLVEHGFDLEDTKESVLQNIQDISEIQQEIALVQSTFEDQLGDYITTSQLDSLRDSIESLLADTDTAFIDLKHNLDIETLTHKQEVQALISSLDTATTQELIRMRSDIQDLVPTRDAYDIAVSNGFKGTEGAWLTSLKGLSAYELAVIHGYQGSQSSWLSTLKGERGDRGPTGDRGFSGIDGKDGAKGDIGPRGLTGAKGDKGEVGQSAYEIAVSEGFGGSKKEWLIFLQADGDLLTLYKFFNSEPTESIVTTTGLSIKPFSYYENFLKDMSKIFDDSKDVVNVNGTLYTTINKQISDAISGLGFELVKSFQTGAVISKHNQALLDERDGKLYRWAGPLIKDVPIGSTPESTGGFGSTAWLEVSDASLSQKLTGSGGASIIGDGVAVFKDLADFIESIPNMTLNSNVFLEQIYQDGDLEHRGNVYKYTNIAKSEAINIPVNGGFLSREYNNYVFAAEFGCAPIDDDGVHTAASNGEALQAAFDFLRPINGHKTLSMGADCYYVIGGTVYSHVSDIHWSFNYTTVEPQYLLVAWHAKQQSYGDYKNVKISKAIYIGDASQVNIDTGRGVTVLHHDLQHIDGLTVEDCTFAECILLGHILDIISCRDIDILNNTFLGSLAIGERQYTELVQISAASTITAYGIPPQNGWGVNLSGLRVRNLKYIGNTVKPYENPVTGIVSYPTRPLGDHGPVSTQNITVRDNTFTDILLPTGVHSNYNYMLNLECHESIEISNNRVSMTDTTAKIFRINGYVSEALNPPRRAQYKITDNIINIARANPSLDTGTVEHIKQQNLIQVFVSANASPASIYPGCDVTISGNNINITDSTADGFELNAFVTTNLTVNEYILKIDNNNFVAKNSKVRSFVSLYNDVRWSSNSVGSSTVVSNNIFKGDVGIGIWRGRNSNTPAYMGGTVKINSNIFDNNYRAVDIDSTGLIYFNDNLLSGYADNALRAPDVINDGNSLIMLNSSRIMSINNALSLVPYDLRDTIKPVYVNSAPADSTAYGLTIYTKL